MNEKNTGKTVKFNLDPKSPSTLSTATKERLIRIQDQDIDFSDIPQSPKEVKWSQPGALISNENKQQVTLRLDAE